METGSSPVERDSHSLIMLEMILLKAVELRLLTYVILLHSLQVEYIDVMLHLILMNLQQCRHSMWEYTTMEVQMNTIVVCFSSLVPCISHSCR